MHSLGLLILLLALLIGLSAAAPKLRVPYPILLVVGGGLLALVPGLPPFRLEPELIFLIFLPPLLYTEAYRMSWPELRANLRPISLLAVGLVLTTTAGIAALAHYVIPGFGWALGFVLGAIISPPDSLEASAITKGLRLPARVVTILEGEGLVNDAAALIAYRYAVAAVISGTFAFWDAGWHFVLVAGGGAALGAAAGYGVARLQNRLTDAILNSAITVLVPFGLYLGAEHLGVSGVLAVVALGMVLSYHAHDIYDNQTRLLKHGFWELVSFLLNGLVFLFIGLALRQVLAGLGPGMCWPLLGYGLLVSGASFVIRVGWVFPSAYLARLAGRWRGHERAKEPLAWQPLLITAWAGMRGVVSLATALALPLVGHGGQAFPQRDALIFLTFVVIGVTLLVQGLTLPWLVRHLGVQEDPAAHAVEEQELRLSLANDSLAYLETKLAAAPTAYADPCLLTLREVTRRQARLLHSTLAANQSARLAPPTGPEARDAERFEQMLRCRLDLTGHQRRLLKYLNEQAAFSGEIIRQVELELDHYETFLHTQLTTVRQPTSQEEKP